MSKFSKYQSKKGGLRYPSLQSSVNINKLLTYPDISQNFTTQINTVPNTTIESNNSDLDESVAEWVARRKQKKELESKQTGLVRQENKTVSNLENVFKPLSSNTSNSIPTLSTVSITSPVLEETNNISSLTENIVQSELDDNKVKEQIRYHEGSRRNKNGEHVAYIDSRGNKTIGYGRLWKHGDPDKMSEEQAVQAFDNDYNSHKEAAKKIPGYDKASPEQKSALINLTYNMGGNFYKKFPNFTKAMELGNYEEATEHLKDSKWYKQVGRRGEDVVGMIRGSKVPKAKFGGYIYKSQSGGFNMDFLKNIAGNWKNYMKDPFSQQSESYINDLVGRNKSALTTRTDLQKQLILPDQNYTQWGDSADAAYTQKIWDDKYASQYGKKWNELDTSVQEGIWKDHKYKRPGLFNDDKLGDDLHQSGAMFDKDKATRTQLGEANKTFNNQLLETGSGIFSLMNAQKEYDNKPQEKFALDFTDDKGILRSQTGGSIPTSPLGLYKYPGQVVNVPGNDITMKGINEPVLAYPNNDKPELMLPGQNYKFPNSTNVVEVPMSQQGGNINNSFNMMNKKYGKKVMSYQSGAPVYQGASPRILPVAPILPKDLEENVKPEYGKSLVDAYKEELKSREGGFDYYQHYMTKGNNNEAFGALIGRAIGNKIEKNKLAKLAKLQEQQDKLDAIAEQKASMQSALNKGLNAYRDKQGDQIAAQFRDKNSNLKEVAVGNTANPATRNFVEKLDDNGTVPGTDVTPANTVASKANSSSGSNGSGAYTPYSIPGDKTYEYAKDSDGNWVTRRRGNREGAYVTLLDNKAAMDKLNREAVAGDLYVGYSAGSGNSGKSRSTSGSNSSGSSSKFKSPLNTSDYTEGAMVRQGDKYFMVGKNGKLIEEKFDAPKMNTSMGSASPSYNLSTTASTSPTNNSNSAAPVSYFKSKGLPYTVTPDQRMLERANAINAAVATSIIPVGKLISKVPIAGKAVNIAGKKVVEIGGKYVDDLGRYVSKKGDVLGKAPKEVIAKTKEFFKVGSKPNPYDDILAGKVNSAGKYIDPFTKKFIPSPKDTRGTLQKLVQDSNLSVSFKNTLNSVATTGKRLSKKAYDALSKTEKNSYDKLISEKVAKMQAGGSTFSRENLFNHYYNNM